MSFYSHKFNDTEHWYSAIDRGMLTVVDCLCYFKHVLLCHNFVVYTDHKPLTTYFSKLKTIDSMGGQVVVGVVLVLTRHETCLRIRQGQCACRYIESSPQLCILGGNFSAGYRCNS